MSLTSANNPIQKIPLPFMNLDELDFLVDSLIKNFELEQGQPSSKSQALCNETIESQGGQVEMSEIEFAWKEKGISKHTRKLQSSPLFPAELSPGRIEWV